MLDAMNATVTIRTECGGERNRISAFPSSGRWMTSGKFSGAIALVILLTQAWATGASATLSVPAVMAPEAGNALSVPVILNVEPGLKVAGLQFDLEFEPEVFDLDVASGAAVKPGSAATAAEKQASYSVLSPGKVRILVFGINQTVLASGEVAVIQFGLTRNNARPTEPLKLQNAILSDLSGSRVPETANDGAVRFSAEAPPGAAPFEGADAPIAGWAVPAVIISSVLVMGFAGILLRRHRSRPKALKVRKRG